MNKPTLLFAFILLGLYTLACNTDQKGQAADETASSATFDKAWATAYIDSVNRNFSKQFANKDTVGMAAYYWPDAEILMEHSEPIKGEGILHAFGAMTRMGVKDFTFVVTDIAGDAEFMIETGNYEMKDDKGALVDRGKYIVIHQNRNGQWKLYRDIGNTSMPAEE